MFLRLDPSTHISRIQIFLLHSSFDHFQSLRHLVQLSPFPPHSGLKLVNRLLAHPEETGLLLLLGRLSLLVLGVLVVGETGGGGGEQQLGQQLGAQVDALVFG